MVVVESWLEYCSEAINDKAKVEEKRFCDRHEKRVGRRDREGRCPLRRQAATS